MGRFKRTGGFTFPAWMHLPPSMGNLRQNQNFTFGVLASDLRHSFGDSRARWSLRQPDEREEPEKWARVSQREGDYPRSGVVRGRLVPKYFPVKITFATQFCFSTRRNQMRLNPSVPTPQLWCLLLSQNVRGGWGRLCHM